MGPMEDLPTEPPVFMVSWWDKRIRRHVVMYYNYPAPASEKVRSLLTNNLADRITVEYVED